MRLQYLAGMGLNSMLYPKIFKEILSYRKFLPQLWVLRGGAWMHSGFCSVHGGVATDFTGLTDGHR